MITYIIKRTVIDTLISAVVKTIDAYYPKETWISVPSCCQAQNYPLRIIWNWDRDIKRYHVDWRCYPRLQLLSSREYKPNEINLEGIFQHFLNVALDQCRPGIPWVCNVYAILLREDYHQLTVFSVGKFPRMVDYIVPSGARIADKPDLGTSGSLHFSGNDCYAEGFINFNAGTLGQCMVAGEDHPRGNRRWWKWRRRRSPIMGNPVRWR